MNVLQHALLLACLAAAAPSALAEHRTGDVEIGDRIAELSFTDTRYLPRSLSEFGERAAYVVVFTTTDCPLVQRYLPRLVALEREFRPRAVQFVAVGVGPQDSLLEIAAQAAEKGGGIPFVKDFDGSTVRALGVERTPQVVVLDGERRLRYRGRVDSQYRLGGVRLRVTSPTATRSCPTSSSTTPGSRRSRCDPTTPPPCITPTCCTSASG